MPDCVNRRNWWPSRLLGGRSYLWLRSAAIGLVAASCVAGPSGGGGPDPWVATSSSTYERYLPNAQAGDPKYQNLLGFMLFFGEGVPVDREPAHDWFHLAADQGYPLAHRNLAIMHRLGLGVERDLAEARRHAKKAGFADLERFVAELPPAIRGGDPLGARSAVVAGGRGEATYTRFCAGCHGLNGIAAFIDSPSFALGDRLEKTDGELLYSIHTGKGAMPGWGNKLSERRLREAMEFARSLQDQYERGIGQALRRAPELYFLFGPMEQNSSAYQTGALN